MVLSQLGMLAVLASASVATAKVCDAGCSTVENVIVGTGGKQTTATSASDCCTQCNNEYGCFAFTYDTE